MIIGVILRNYKTYKPITFIPISNGDKFCGLIGKNGIGKSSILEALDFYFNNKLFKLNVNNPNAGNEDCYVVPVFLIEKTLFCEQNGTTAIAESYSNVMWDVFTGDITKHSINNNYTELFKSIGAHIKSIYTDITKQTHFLLPIGESRDHNVSIGSFRDNVFLDSIIPSEHEGYQSATKIQLVTEILSPLNEKIKSLFQYVYIPKDIEADKLVQFETLEIQTLLGTKLESIISNFLSKKTVNDISQGLKGFIDELSDKLPNYKFKTPSIRQPNLKADKIFSLIVQEFFSIRELHKEGSSGKDISIKNLSSGEKQQAILTLIHSIISEYRDNSTKTLIVAVDEPESSLHISACYNQFEKLHEISKECRQVLFSSHWYGFIPAIHNGTITNIIVDNLAHKGYIFNIHKYREEIKLSTQIYGRTEQKQLPIDVLLKSSNDFSQSILMSVISDDHYNWLICEGSSDKIYLEAYLSDEIKNKKLRIIPVCAASEIKKTYAQLAVLFEDLKYRLKGKVFLLMDTDEQLVSFKTESGLDDNLRCRRLVNDTSTKITKLVKISDSHSSPNTDIEDTLNGKIYNKTLNWFKCNGATELDLISDSDKDEIPSYFAMDFRQTEYEVVDKFLNDNHGNNKMLFAQKYVELMESKDVVPSWIEEIRAYFNA